MWFVVDKVELIITIIFLEIFFGWFFYGSFIKIYRNQNISQKIGWIVIDQDYKNSNSSSLGIHLRSLPLESYITNEQTKLDIPDKFKFSYSNEFEMKNLKKLLSVYKENVIDEYFRGFLSNSKKLCSLPSSMYFIVSLFGYLGEQLSTDKSTIKFEVYDYKDNDDSYSFYTLTEFGRVCYKLYLITVVYIKNNPSTDFVHVDTQLKDCITEYLEKNEVAFIHHGL